MKRATILIYLLSILIISFAHGQEIYRWVDEKGIRHFADDLTLVPEKYRDQVQKKKPPRERGASLSADSQESDGKTEPLSPSGKKDLVGRGEDWWRAKVKEWNDKLQDAQKNYDEAYEAWKAKQQQREDSKFKPHSQRKRLTGEVKDLDEKAKGREKELEEVKNMVEKVLPKQAEDYGADPSWLKPKEEEKTTPVESAPDSK